MATIDAPKKDSGGFLDALGTLASIAGGAILTATGVGAPLGAAVTAAGTGLAGAGAAERGISSLTKSGDGPQMVNGGNASQSAIQDAQQPTEDPAMFRRRTRGM